MQVSISKAHKLTGVARSTIYKDIENGTLSVTTGARKKKTIMVSELERVYGDIKAPTNEDKKDVSLTVAHVSKGSDKSRIPQTEQVAVLQERIEALRGKASDAKFVIEDIKQERKKDREIYQEQIDTLKEALYKAQEGQNRLTLLLEDQRSKDSGAGEWEKALKALEHRIANQEANEKNLKERAQKEINKHKNALEEEKKKLKAEQNKTVWQKLFG